MSGSPSPIPSAARPRHVVFVNRVYPPVEGATGQLLADWAEALAQSGCRASVITSAGAGAEAGISMRNGVRVVRVRGLPFTRASHWRRGFSYLSLYPRLGWQALRARPCDVLVTMTDPPLQLVLGAARKAVQNCRLVHWAQDVYPEVAEELGVLRRRGLVANLCRRVSNAALRRHDVIVAVGECMRARLLARGIAPGRIVVIPNWGLAETGAGGDGSAAKQFRAEQQWSGKFVVMYSGNFGLAHEFAAIMEAARSLEQSVPRVVFAFVGDGPRWETLRNELAELRNVTFLPPQSREALAASLDSADVHLASMRPGLAGLVVPSKVAGVVSAGRPCVFLGPAESAAAQLILRHGCGAVMDPGDGSGLAALLRRGAGSPELLAQWHAGLSAARSELQRTAAVGRLSRLALTDDLAWERQP